MAEIESSKPKPNPTFGVKMPPADKARADEILASLTQDGTKKSDVILQALEKLTDEGVISRAKKADDLTEYLATLENAKRIVFGMESAQEEEIKALESRYEERIETLNTQNKALKEALEKAEKIADKATESESKALETQKACESALEDKNALLENLTATLAEQKNRLAEATEQSAAAQTESRAANAELLKLKDKLSAVEKTNSGLVTNNAVLEAEKQAAIQTQATLEEHIADLKEMYK